MKDKMGGDSSMHEAGKKLLQNFSWKLEGKGPLRTLRRRSEDNIKTDLEEN
jgi:hypothetical protein